MQKLYNIPTDKQLFDIATAINDSLDNLKKENIYVVFELDKELLRQVDEDFFFRNDKNAKVEDFIPSEEVNVIVSDIKFKFIEKQMDDEEEK